MAELLGFEKVSHILRGGMAHQVFRRVRLLELAVMHHGQFEQADTPEYLMRHPATEYVADFFKAEQFSHRLSVP